MADDTEVDKDFIEGDVEGHDPFDPLDQKRANMEADDREKQGAAAARAVLERRQLAFIRVFKGGATKEDLDIVSADLDHFCMGSDTVFHADERVHCLLTGRQEVFRRIQDHTSLSLDTLVQKYTRPV